MFQEHRGELCGVARHDPRMERGRGTAGLDGRKDERRIEISIGLARFPFVPDLNGFDYAAQPSIDKKQIREIAAGRFIALLGFAEQLQRVRAGHVDVGENRDQGWLDLTRERRRDRCR
jgi:IstB-like ATP binding protein